MIEPTETESKETLDAFAETLFRITEEDARAAARSAAHHARSAGPTKCRRPASRSWHGTRVVTRVDRLAA